MDTRAQGTDDAESQIIWRLHRQRMRSEISNLRVGMPHPALTHFDPYGLRVAATLLFIIGLAAAGSDATTRLKRAIVPQLSFLHPSPPPVVDAWITSPAYTGIAPKHLTGAKENPTEFIEVPSFSQLSVRISGAIDTPLLHRASGTISPRPLDEKNHGFDIGLTKRETISITVGDTKLAEWSIRTTPDVLPQAAFLSTPTEGRNNVLRIDFQANDDYGLTSLRAKVSRPSQISSSEKNKPKSLDLPLPKIGAKKVVSTSYHDLTSHPWAGLPVQIHLEATDAAGQVGRNESTRVILPERKFKHPVAQEIVIERRKLSTDFDYAELVGDALNDIAWQQERYADDISVFLALRTATHRLFKDPSEKTIRAIQALLWDTALGIEDGKFSVAQQILRDAEDALYTAFEKNADDSNLSKLMDDLEEAMKHYFDELAKMMKDIDWKKLHEMPENNKAVALSRGDFQELMDQIRRLANSGSRIDAKRMLSQMKNLLENMRTGRMASVSYSGQRSMNLLNGLQKLIKDQQELLDRTFHNAKQLHPLPPNSGNPKFSQPSDSETRPDMTKPNEVTRNDASAQEALRHRLGELMRQLGEMINLIPRPMSRAERSMRRSANFLEIDRPDEAIEPQTKALNQLRESTKKATQTLMQQMDKSVGGRPNRMSNQRDPFGRKMGSSNVLDTSDIGFKGQSGLKRARKIRNELRRRASQQSRSKSEHDYINRLLQTF